jgi:hypothetical protein
MLATKSASGGERMIETTTPWLVLYTMLGYLILWGVYSTIKDNAFQSGYWKGRKDGFDMHRRMIDSKIDADNN